MSGQIATRYPYIFDASSLIELERANLLRRIATGPPEVVIPQQVYREVDKDGSRIASWLYTNRVPFTRLHTSDENRLFLRLIQDYRGLGYGEAAVIAIAAMRNGTAVTEDRLAQRVAGDLHVPWEGITEYMVRMAPRLS